MQNSEIDKSISGAVDDAIARAVAIGGLAAVALIHILQLPEAFDQVGYLGGLFIAAVVASLALAAVMTRTSHDLVWAGSGLFAAVILLGYVISRSVGLPGFTEDMGVWDEPLGLASMAAEGLVIGVSAATLAKRGSTVPSARPAASGRLRKAM
jgi:hypothetical protein